jgi:hypothetical protein
MSKNARIGLVVAAELLLIAGMPESRPPRRATVVEREGRIVVLEVEGGTQRVLRLGDRRLPAEYAAVLGAGEGAVLRNGRVDPLERQAKVERLRRLRSLLTARRTQD